MEAVPPLGGAIGVRHVGCAVRQVHNVCHQAVRPSPCLSSPGGPVMCRGRCRVRWGIWGAGCGRGLGGYAQWPFHRDSGGRQASHSSHAVRHSPQPRVGPTPWGPGGSSGAALGSGTNWSPQTKATLRLRSKVCTSSRTSATGRGEAAHGCSSLRRPVEVSRDGHKDLVWVPARSHDEGEQGGVRCSCQRVCPLWW